MKRTWSVFSLALVAMAGVVAAAAAKEVTIHRDALPAAVSAALTSRYPSAEILRLTKETTRGATVYEAEMKVSARRVDASFDASGKLREQEAEIATTDLPNKVRAALAQSAQGHWTLTHAECITSGKTSTLPRYELVVKDHGVQLELIYTADGNRVSGEKVTE